MAIEIDGKKYKVVENLGFSHCRGEYAKVVLTEEGERVVVKSPGRYSPWRFSKPIVLLAKAGGVCGQTG